MTTERAAAPLPRRPRGPAKTRTGCPTRRRRCSPSYRLAFSDPDFLTRDELRPVRLQLELLKTEMALAERGIVSTVVMFGSARIPDPDARPPPRAPALARARAATTPRRASSPGSAPCGRSPPATART